MANFDALRSAIIGPFAYICRPKEKPSELLACYPFNGTMADISRYARGNAYTSQLSTYDNTSTPPSVITSTAATTWNLYPQSCNLAHPWSFEMWLKGVQNATISFGMDFKLRGYSGSYGKYIAYSVWSGTFQLDSVANMFNGLEDPVWEHHAFAYDGNKVYYYYNGVMKREITASLSGTQQLCSVVEPNTSYTKAIGNCRFVQKFLGTASQYPVTSTPFTGYEVL